LISGSTPGNVAVNWIQNNRVELSNEKGMMDLSSWRNLVGQQRVVSTLGIVVSLAPTPERSRHSREGGNLALGLGTTSICTHTSFLALSE
jgi:hypothetical protein